MNTTTRALNEADRVLHSLAQLIALTGTNLLPNLPDDSQANIHWNADHNRLEGRSFAYGLQSLRLVIDLSTFSLQLLDENDGPVFGFAAEGETPEAARSWWQTVLQDWGFRIDKPLNFQLDTTPIALATPYIRPSGLREWANWRTVANEQLAELNSLSGLASEIRMWPHHFDTGVYYSLPDNTGRERAAIWAGYAIADAISDTPYFYLSGYSARQSVNFGTATPLPVGRWLMRPNWQGAYLPVSDTLTADQVSRFFSESFGWVSAQVGA